MITINRKEDCVGCEACAQICGKNCITFEEDAMGCVYPKVNANKCIDCGACEKICPVLNHGEEREPAAVFAAKHQDPEIAREAASAGAMSALAEWVIGQGGIVFGADMDGDFEAFHSHFMTVDSLKRFRDSKYMQSRQRDCFPMVKAALDAGQFVLFTGTPCQVMALRNYLRVYKKDYIDRLITADIICHGVPAPGIWRSYLRMVKHETEKKLHKELIVSDVKFRNKKGDDDYGLLIGLADKSGYKVASFWCSYRKNLYYRGFLRGFFKRPSCFECPAKGGCSGADFTMADFWGAEENYPHLHQQGLRSMILVNTPLAAEIIDKLRLVKSPVEAEKALQKNPAFRKSAPKPEFRDFFLRHFEKEGDRAFSIISNLKTGNALKRLIFKHIYRSRAKSQKV